MREPVARDLTLCHLPARAETIDDGSRVTLTLIALSCRLEIRRIASQVREPVARDQTLCFLSAGAETNDGRSRVTLTLIAPTRRIVLEIRRIAS